MARSRIASRGTGFAVTLDWDGVEQTTRDFRAVRRRIARELDQIQARAGEKTVLPDARRRAAHLKVEGQSVAAALIVRRGRAAPYLTSRLRGRRARAIGLLEFGGTVHGEIRPRKGRALVINGQPVAVVRTPRVHHAREFMADAAAAKRYAFAQEVRDQLVGTFGAQGFTVR